MFLFLLLFFFSLLFPLCSLLPTRVEGIYNKNKNNNDANEDSTIVQDDAVTINSFLSLSLSLFVISRFSLLALSLSLSCSRYCSKFPFRGRLRCRCCGQMLYVGWTTWRRIELRYLFFCTSSYKSMSIFFAMTCPT